MPCLNYQKCNLIKMSAHIHVPHYNKIQNLRRELKMFLNSTILYYLSVRCFCHGVISNNLFKILELHKLHTILLDYDNDNDDWRRNLKQFEDTCNK